MTITRNDNWILTCCLLGLTLCPSLVAGQSKTIQSFIDRKQTAHRFYFYPSTLRMINLDRDPNYYELIKGIEKLIFFRLNQDSFNRENFQAAVKDLYAEGFEDLIVVEDNERQVYVMGRDQPDETVVIAHSNGDYYVADVQGSIDFLELPDIYSGLIQRDSLEQKGFINVLNLFEKRDRNKRKVPPKNTPRDSVNNQNRS